MPIAKLDSFKPCQICGKFIHKGQSISRFGCAWIHSDCVQLAETLTSTVKSIQCQHRSSLAIPPNQYEVSYSLRAALSWAREHDLVTQELYDKITKSPLYKSILDYVPD